MWLQGQSEHYLEMLHGLAERELQERVDVQVEQEEWGKFREKLIGLTDVTKQHFEKLVQVQKLTSPFAQAFATAD